MNRNIIDRLYWLFWCSTTILIGIVAGFMISHSLILGRFFTWFIESGNVDLLHQTFTVFRGSSNYHLLYFLYWLPLYLAFVSGVIWVVLACLLKRDRIIAIIAGLTPLYQAVIFYVSDLDEAEPAVLSGTANESLTQLFVSINVPIHTCFGVMFVVGFLLLLVVALKKIKI